MKECFGIELANRFFSGAYGVDAEDPDERQKRRKECYNCPDFEHCCMVLNLVYQMRQAEKMRRGTGKPQGQLT